MATTRADSFLRQLTRRMAAERCAERPDRELVERVLAGHDEGAFEALVRRHGPMVYRVCWRVLHQAQDCEDAFQATFLVLAQKLSTVKKRGSLASWLHGVARRVALDAKKRLGRRRRHEGGSAGAAQGPPEDITWKELREVLDTELASLPEKHRLPLILCYLEGRTQEEAAKQIGWSKSTLLRRLEEARGALGRRLTRKGFVWPASLAAILISDCLAQAALSPKLVGLAVDAAACVLAGNTTAEIISTKVTALAEGVLKAMFVTKVKPIVAAALVGVGVLAGSLVGVTAQTSRDERGAGQEARSTPAGIPEMKPVVIREGSQPSVLAWSSDGKVVATACARYEKTKQGTWVSHGTVKLWGPKTGKLMKSLGEKKNTQIAAIAFSPDKKHAAIAGLEVNPNKAAPGGIGFVQIVDTNTWTVTQELDDLPAPQALAFSPDGKTLAIGGGTPLALEEKGKGAYVKLWDVHGEKMKAGTRFAAALAIPEGKLGPIPHSDVTGLAFSPDGKLLAATERDDKGRTRIHLYDGQTAQPQKEWGLGGAENGLARVAFTADGKKLVSVFGQAKLWDAHTGKEPKSLDTKNFLTHSLSVSPDGRHLAAAGRRKEADQKMTQAVLVWDAKTGELKRIVPWDEASMGIISLAFSPDGRSLAISGGKYWDDNMDQTNGVVKIVPAR